MSKKFRLSAKVTGLLAAVLTASLNSATGFSAVGEFNTVLPEDQLFIEDGRILRCDLFFSVPGKDPVVAPKGSAVGQSIPPIVWQYSGLLPVSDYLKSAVIHSSSTDLKELPWQEVQLNFFNGLQIEGAHQVDAKIAYAGAYAFAPRWPLVAFIEVNEAVKVYPDSTLYDVEFVQPKEQGMSVENYRALSLEILQQPEDVSLQDINTVIDAADMTHTKSRERASLGGFSDVISGSNVTVKSINNTAIKAANIESSGEVAQEDNSIGAADQQAVPSESVTDTKASVEQAIGAVKSTAGLVVGDNGAVIHSGDGPVAKSNDGIDSSQKELAPIEMEAISDTAADDTLAIETGLPVEFTNAEESDPAAVFGREVFDLPHASQDSQTSQDNQTSQATGLPVVVETLPEGSSVEDSIVEDEIVPQEIETLPLEATQTEGIVRLPADKLFYDDKVALEVSPEVVTDDGLAQDGLSLDLTELAKEINTPSLETAEAESVIEDGTQNNSEDEWVVLPDGTTILQSVERLYTE